MTNMVDQSLVCPLLLVSIEVWLLVGSIMLERNAMGPDYWHCVTEVRIVTSFVLEVKELLCFFYMHCEE
jgi:hypothetical protein